MRIDLPGCNFTNCKYCFDGNCTNKNQYDICEYNDVRNAESIRLEQMNGFNPHETEAVTLVYNLEQSTHKEISRTVNALATIFPKYSIIALPDFMSLHGMSKDVLENYISMIQEVIDKLQEDR